jgi:hypothetical protein
MDSASKRNYPLIVKTSDCRRTWDGTRSANFWTVVTFISRRRTQWSEAVRYHAQVPNQNDWYFPVCIFKNPSWQKYSTILQIIEKFKRFSMPSYMDHRVAISSAGLARFNAIAYRKPDSRNTVLGKVGRLKNSQAESPWLKSVKVSGGGISDADLTGRGGNRQRRLTSKSTNSYAR